MNIKEYFNSKGISEEILVKLMIEKNKERKNLPFNNRAVNGYNIKKNLTHTISITKPKIWPERGYIEF